MFIVFSTCIWSFSHHIMRAILCCNGGGKLTSVEACQIDRDLAGSFNEVAD